ncbi:winged helix-turn-helix domain-containing protein [Saccharolobus caldissimus]|nr:winged helix-turn-helix domain-containing protein [Saccharolobus caldissimus]
MKKLMIVVISIILFHFVLFMVKYYKNALLKCPFVEGYIVILPIDKINLSDMIKNSKCRYNMLKVLELLAEFNEDVTIDMISNRLNISRKLIKKYLDKLEERGLVEFTYEKTYRITENGRQLINRMKSSGF